MDIKVLRTWKGRVLARQDEDIDDQGLGFDVTTLVHTQRSARLVGRRQVLSFGGAGVAAVTLAACGATDSATTSASPSTSSASTSGLTEIPDETNGPYPGDGTNGPDALEESGIIRSDIRSSFGTSTTTATGVPMTLRLNIYDLANGGAAYEGAAVYVWHCTDAGEYSMYSEGLEEENFLRGVQVADADGLVEFTSIFPGCYSGRWPHIHFEVYPDSVSISDAAKGISTSQVALPQEACDAVYATSGYEKSGPNLAQVTLASDNVFGDDGGASQLGSATGDVTDGYVVSLKVGVDATTEAQMSMAGGGGQGGAPGGAPGDAGSAGSDGAPSGAPGGSTGGPMGPPPSGEPPAGAPRGGPSGTPTASATTSS